MSYSVSGQLSPKENCPAVRVGASVKVRVNFRVDGGATRQLSRRKIDPWLGLRYGLGLVLG